MRRAARRARQEAAPADAVRTEAVAEAARRHPGVRHPRPGRGAGDVRSHCRDERRQGRTGRHPHRDLRPAGDPLRRRFYRRHQSLSRRTHRNRHGRRAHDRQWPHPEAAGDRRRGCDRRTLARTAAREDPACSPWRADGILRAGRDREHQLSRRRGALSHRARRRTANPGAATQQRRRSTVQSRGCGGACLEHIGSGDPEGLTAMTQQTPRGRIQGRMGVVVIGQSPRPSVAAEIAAVLSPGMDIDLRGALDGMTRAEIDAIPPVDGYDALFTLLPSGDGVVISKKEVEKRADVQLARFRSEGVGVAMLACTGKFPNLSPEGLVILPSAVLHNMVDAVLPKGRLGVFSPLSEQTALIAKKWERAGVEVVGVTLRPGSSDAEVDDAAKAMAALAPDLLVMDCMGYTSANKARVRLSYGGPVILAIAAAARVVEELVS